MTRIPEVSRRESAVDIFSLFGGLAVAETLSESGVFTPAAVVAGVASGILLLKGIHRLLSHSRN